VTQIDKKPPGVFQTLRGVMSHVKSINSPQNNCKCLSFLATSTYRNDTSIFFFSSMVWYGYWVYHYKMFKL